MKAIQATDTDVTLTVRWRPFFLDPTLPKVWLQCMRRGRSHDPQALLTDAPPRRCLRTMPCIALLVAAQRPYRATRDTRAAACAIFHTEPATRRVAVTACCRRAC